MVFKLMEGFQNHNKTYMPKHLKNKSGIESKNDQVQVDKTVLENIPQRETANQLDKVPSVKEIKSAINDMTHDKVPGQSGVATEVMKNLPKQALDLYIEIIQNFWND
jgi:hypothetical protein